MMAGMIVSSRAAKMRFSVAALSRAFNIGGSAGACNSVSRMTMGADTAAVAGPTAAASIASPDIARFAIMLPPIKLRTDIGWPRCKDQV